MFQGLDRRRVLSWALYDWANSAFAVTMMAGLFPIFFGAYWCDNDTERAGYHLQFGNSIAGLIVAISAPILGAIADRGGLKKRFLLLFTCLGTAMTFALALLPQVGCLPAVLLYVAATLGFSGSITFYDSLLGEVSPPGRTDLVSAIGYAAGYLGGGLLFLVNVLMVTAPERFGLPNETVAVKVSFASVAVWWGLFSIPILLFVPEGRPTHSARLGSTVKLAFGQLAETFRDLRRYRPAFTFLIAYWLYIDGVDTIIRMATWYGTALELPSASLIQALLITQFVGFPAAIAFGHLGTRIGAKRGIFLALSVYLGVTVWGYFLDSVWEFYALAVTIGLVQGGVQSLSRSMFQRLVPADKVAQFFGFYNTLGKFAVVLGPLLMAAAQALTGNVRNSILALLILFVGGMLVLTRVPEPELTNREAHPPGESGS